MKNKDQITGKIKNAKGEIREELGRVTGNTSEEIAGKKDKVVGRVQETVGDAKKNFSK